MKLLSISLLALSLSGMAAHAQTDTDLAVKINLGTADKFAVIAGAGITNTSHHTFIIGDVGQFPDMHRDGAQDLASEGSLVPQVQQCDCQGTEGSDCGV